MFLFHAFSNEANFFADVCFLFGLNAVEADIEHGSIVHSNVYIFIDYCQLQNFTGKFIQEAKGRLHSIDVQLDYLHKGAIVNDDELRFFADV